MRKQRAIYWTGIAVVPGIAAIVLLVTTVVGYAQRRPEFRPFGRFIVQYQQTMNNGESFVVLDTVTAKCHAFLSVGGVASGVIQDVPCE